MAVTATEPRTTRARPRLGTVAIWAVLAAIVAAGFALRLESSEHVRGRLAADERSYLRLADDLRVDATFGDAGLHHPHHWAPGTPVLFAAAQAIAGTPPRQRVPEAPLHAQAVVGAATALAVFGVTALLAGPIAGLVAAAAVSLYPPSIVTAWFFVSEPLGGLTLALAVLALVWAWRGGAARWALAGAALGVACLARADLLVPALATCVLAAILLLRAHGARAAAARSAAAVVALCAVLAPWAAYASARTAHFVPITDGATSTLLVGTYLPGDGTVFGLKHDLAAEARRIHPGLRHRPTWRIPSTAIMDALAARHPDLGRQAALSAELRDQLQRYVVKQPLPFAGMEARKLWRMWGGYYHGGHRPVLTTILWWHRALVAFALAGMLAGLVATRRPELGLVLALLLLATAVDVLFVAEPRHNIRLMPVLVAGGIAGWGMLLRERRPFRLPHRGTRGTHAALG